MPKRKKADDCHPEHHGKIFRIELKPSWKPSLIKIDKPPNTECSNGLILSTLKPKRRQHEDDHLAHHSEILRIELKPNRLKLAASKMDKSPANPKPAVTTYKGKNPGDAGALIDKSQGEFGLNSSIPGHARGHVSRGSNGVEAREMYCVENFSLASDERKTGFFLRTDQNKFVHKALSSPQGQDKLKCLNMPGKFEVLLCASMGDFQFCGGTWEKGELKETFKPDRGVVVLQHRRRYLDPCKPPPATQSVHIFTAYPLRLKKSDRSKDKTPGGGGGGNKPDHPGCPPGCDQRTDSWYTCDCR